MNIIHLILLPIKMAQKPFLASLASGLGTAVAGGLGNMLFGQSEGSQDRDVREAQQNTLQQVQLGNDLDLRNQKAMFDFRMERAAGAGLTNVEAYGSGIGSAGGGTTGSGQTLGNAANNQDIANKQRQQEMKLAWQTKVADNATKLQQTKMQTDTQKEIAGVQAGTQSRGQDIQKAIAEGRLKLDRDTYYLNLKTASANIGKTEQETAKLINDTATSDPKFITAMKQLSMGPANLLVELTMRHHGIALNDKSFMALSKQEREAILGQILALSSSAYTEGKGAAALGGSAVEGGSNFIENIMNIFKGNGQGIEQTPAAPSLGRGARFAEPGAYGPNMNYR